MEHRGIRRYGQPLRPPADAVTVRVREGTPVLTEGPFAETAEHMAAYELLECADLEEAPEADARPGARELEHDDVRDRADDREVPREGRGERRREPEERRVREPRDPLRREEHEGAQEPSTDPVAEAAKFVDKEKGVENADDALAGARDIIAEWVNEDQSARAKIRELFVNEANFVSKVITGKEAEGEKYKNYYDWTEPVSTAPSHRVLAMRRGERKVSCS
jgi:hypothetical protein